MIKRNVGHGFLDATSFQALYDAYYIARRGTSWKASVQNYGFNVLSNSYKQQEKLRTGKYKPKGFVEFDIVERGKKRHIMSVHISERVVQKAICREALIPILEKSLIYDNGASQKNKGTEFAARRLKKHLAAYYRKHGNSGYVVLGDGHDYFASLRHDKVRYILERNITDERLIELVMMFVDAVPQGLSLGSEVNQILAVAYANEIDHYIKDELGIKYYGHYMDDWYIIVPTKEEAQKLLLDLSERYRQIGITLNEKKTQIVRLRHGFIWLQDRYYLTDSGKIIRKPSRKAIYRNRRKLRKLAEKWRLGEITERQFDEFYKSHIGYLKHKDAHDLREQFTELYKELKEEIK